MKYEIVASTWASFSKAVAAVATGSWLAFAICPTAFAADGAQAAAAAKKAAALLEQARAVNADAGIDDAVTAVAAKIRRLKN